MPRKRTRGPRGSREKIYDRQIVDANYQPTPADRNELSVVTAMPGYSVIERIALAVVASQKQRLMEIMPNDPDYDRKVIEHHRRAQVCEGVWEEIRREIEKQCAIAQEITEEKINPDQTSQVFEDVEREMGIRD